MLTGLGHSATLIAASAGSHQALVTLALAAALGIILAVAAGRLRVPAIVVLLVGGVTLGPEGLGWIEPEHLGETLPVIVSLAVGLILFEGGLTLEVQGPGGTSRIVARLLTLGAVVTWLGASAAVWLVFGTTVSMALVAGSLVIVTGPTVISPLLKRIKVEPQVHGILHWEGVLIDPVGVFIALVCYEWVAGQTGDVVALNFGLRIAVGGLLGAAGGWAVVQAFRREFVPEDMVNAFALGSALAVFAAAELIVNEAGLLAVTVAGFVIGWLKPAPLEQIRAFKAEITDLLIGLLFILLAARLSLEQFTAVGWKGIAVVALIVLAVRPLNVLLCAWGTDLSWRQRTFLAWVAPRGIVAASMASLFALGLRDAPALGDADPRLLETITYFVIGVTVIVQGFSAGGLARLLDLKRPPARGWLVVGANTFARRVAHFLAARGDAPVFVIDSSARLVAQARQEGLTAFRDDAARVQMIEQRQELLEVGSVLALTDNAELNELVCQRWSGALELHESAYRWGPDDPTDDRPGRIAFAVPARPSVLSLELERGHAVIAEHDVAGGESDGTALVFDTPQGLRTAAAVSSTEREGAGRVLSLMRGGGYLGRALSASAVIDVAAADLDTLYERLVDTAVARAPSISREASLRELDDAKGHVPTITSHGVAILHIYSRHSPQRVCVLARISGPLEVDGASEPVRLVFLIVSPKGDPEGHLATLAEIARLVDDDAWRDAMVAEADLERARALVRERVS
ncbi:MAG: cation:proton antiporter [Nannocystaceae bacterium]|nr:cation:proton antiporter [bacterium]